DAIGWISVDHRPGSKCWTIRLTGAQVRTSNGQGGLELEVWAAETSNETSNGARAGDAAIPHGDGDAPASEPPTEPPTESRNSAEGPSTSRSKPSGKANLGVSSSPRARGQ